MTNPVGAARVAAGQELTAWVDLWISDKTGFSPEDRDHFLNDLATMLEGAADTIRRERHKPVFEQREAERKRREATAAVKRQSETQPIGLSGIEIDDDDE